MLKKTCVSCALLFGYLSQSHASFPVFHNQFLPYHQHYLSSVQTNGELIEIDDGSLWKVNRYQVNRVMYWHANDVVEISPSLSLYGERFYLTNRTKNSSVSVELSYGPIRDNPFTQQITNIERGEVFLTSIAGESSRWLIEDEETHRLIQWTCGQSIIIGRYSSWFSFLSKENAYILLNVENNEYIKAKPYVAPEK